MAKFPKAGSVISRATFFRHVIFSRLQTGNRANGKWCHQVIDSLPGKVARGGKSNP